MTTTKPSFLRWLILTVAFIVLVILNLQNVVSDVAMPAAAVRKVTFQVSPAATGSQLVRISLPLPAGFLGSNQTLVVQAPDGTAKPVEVRVLARYHTGVEADGVRQALITFPWKFLEERPIDFTLAVGAGQQKNADAFPASVYVEGECLAVEWRDGRRAVLKFLAPPRTLREAPRREVVEENRYFLWQRFHFADSAWPRVIETRLDAAGGIVIVEHIQRLGAAGNYAPELGWEFTLPAKEVRLTAGGKATLSTDEPLRHTFKNGQQAECVFDGKLVVYHPAAAGKQRGGIEAFPAGDKIWTYRYQRCSAADKVPMQPMSWQRVEIVLAPPGLARLTAALTSPHTTILLSKDRTSSLTLPPLLETIVRYHREAIVRSAAVGDDFGNVTGYSDGSRHGSVFGMNRLNHGAAIFEEGRCSGDRRLIETGLLWCDNFHDQSIWWGEKERGGTRYNNVVAMKQTPPSSDYMWRSDSAVNFCTKGYDCFQLAWEETGDPRMQEALQAQVAYAAKHLHANQGECRSIGDVRDFLRLYEHTGEPTYLAEALRLCRELRTKLSTGHLFDQGGKPLTADPPFIDEDERGLQVGYAKPYIIGYALAGLPELMRYTPEEPDLKETVRAVADFLASTVDPAGGWRYPHPRSSGVIVNQGMEHAWQLTQAVRALGPESQWLDAIETVLRSRTLFWQRTGMIFSGLEGWEISTGKVKDCKELQQLYQRPVDRDTSRDYTDGRLSFGSSAPEGLVYFQEVLACYLEHRPAQRLLAEPRVDEPLGQLLSRAPRKSP